MSRLEEDSIVKQTTESPLSLQEELKKVLREREALQRRFNDLERDWHKKRYNLDWYFRKSSNLEEEKKEREADLERKEAEIAELKFSVEKKTKESNRDRKNYMSLCLLHEKEKAEKEILLKKVREKDERLKSFAAELNQKQEEILKLTGGVNKLAFDGAVYTHEKESEILAIKKEAELWQDEKSRILNELAEEKCQVERQGQLIRDAGDYIMQRDVKIAELTEYVNHLEQDKMQLEEKLKIHSEESKVFEETVEKLREHCKVSVPHGGGNLEALSFLVDHLLTQIGMFDKCYQIIKDVGLNEKIAESHSQKRKPLRLPPPPPINVFPKPRSSSYALCPPIPPCLVGLKTENHVNKSEANFGNPVPVEITAARQHIKRKAYPLDDNCPEKHRKHEKPFLQNVPAVSNVIKIDNSDENIDVNIEF